MNFYVGDDMKIADAAMVRNGASRVSRGRPRTRRLLKMRAISRRSREIERGADAVRDLAGNSLEFTGVDLLNTKFQLFNFKYQEVSSDPPHSQRWPWTCRTPYCMYDSSLIVAGDHRGHNAARPRGSR